MPISPGYLPSLALLTANTPNLSVLIPDFTLSWSATYPTQLRQGVDTLKFVVYTLNKPPSNVSIAGDSAGGNLALGVLAHLLHPHPEIPPLDIIHEGRRGKLARAVLISPWASFATDWGSVKRNTKKDMLTEHINQVWSRNFLGRRGRDGWNEALSVDGEWWNGLEDVIQEVLITAGEEEILADCIKELGKRFQVSCYDHAMGNKVMLIKCRISIRMSPLLLLRESGMIISSWIYLLTRLGLAKMRLLLSAARDSNKNGL